MAEARRKTLKIALTGGAGSGKSAVAEQLAARGITVVDTDALAREVVAPGEAGLAAVVDAFGQQVLDDQGRLDRRALRQRILDNDADRQRLEGMLHPLIMDRLQQRLDAADGPYAVAEIPLLVEGGYGDRFDRIVTVEAATETRIRRLMERDGVDESAARQLIDAQASEADRRAIADWVIDNDGDQARLEQQVVALDRSLRQAA